MVFSQSLNSHDLTTKATVSSVAGTGSSKTFIFRSSDQKLSVWQVKRFGEEQAIFKHTASNNDIRKAMENALASCWQLRSILYILQPEGKLSKCDINKQTLVACTVADDLQHFFLSNQSMVDIFPHFNGLIAIARCQVVTIQVKDNDLKIEHRHDLPEARSAQVKEMVSSFSFVAITIKQNFLLIQTTEHEIVSQVVDAGLSFSIFSHACLLRPANDIFVTVDESKMLRLYSMYSKAMILESPLNFSIGLLISTPSSKAFFFEENGQRVLVTNVKIQEGVLEMSSVTPITTKGISFATQNQTNAQEWILGNSERNQIFLTDTLDQEPHLRVKTYLDLESRFTAVSFRESVILLLMVEKQCYGKMVTVVERDKSTDDLFITQVIRTSEYCTGLCLSNDGDRFFTLLQTDKTLASFSIKGESFEERLPSAETKSIHVLGLYCIQKSENRLVLIGEAGLISYLEPNEGTHKSAVRMFGNLQETIKCFDLIDDSLLLVVGQSGTVHILERDYPSHNMKTTLALQVLDPATGKSNARSWLEDHQQRLHDRKRESHQEVLDTIASGLSRIKSQVSSLLKENESLPSHEQLNRHDFELNSDEKQRLYQEGCLQEKNLVLELKAKHQSVRRIGDKLKASIWDHMAVKGRSIEGIQSKIIVSNYVLLPISSKEMRELQKIIAHRKSSSNFSDLSKRLKNIQDSGGKLPAQLEHLGSMEVPLDSPIPSANATPRLSSYEIGTPQIGSEIEDGWTSNYGNTFNPSLIKDSFLFPQLEISTLLHSQKQILLLRNAIHQFKTKFNRNFDSLFEKKFQMIHEILKWKSELDRVGCSEGLYQITRKPIGTDFVSWSLVENPEVVFNFLNPERIPIKQDSSKAVEHIPSFDTTKEIIPPDFQGQNELVELSPAQQSVLEEFKDFISSRKKHETRDNRSTSNTQILLERRVEESVNQFERDLEDLYRHKITYQKSVLTEELRILLHVERMARVEELQKEETAFKNEIVKAKAQFENAEKQLAMGTEALDQAKNLLSDLSENDKLLDKNFKKSFQGLNYNQLESLLKAFRKRPRAGASIERTIAIFTKKDPKHSKILSMIGQKDSKDPRSKSIASTLEKMCNMFLGPASARASGPPTSGVQALSLDELDRSNHCPESVNLDSWRTLCQLRRKKIASEERIAGLVAHLAETEEFVQESNRSLEQETQRRLELQRLHTDWRKKRNREVNDTELVLSIPRGQVEMELNDFDPFLGDAILLTENVVKKANAEIDRSGAFKLAAQRESRQVQNGTKMLQWERDKLLFQKEEANAKWFDIQQTKLSKESRGHLETLKQLKNNKTIEGGFSMTDEYSRLDKSTQQTDQYLTERLEQLKAESESIKMATQKKETNNSKLQDEIYVLANEIEETRKIVQESTPRDKSDERIARAMKRNRLVIKIKEQNELIVNLRDQLDTYMFSSFPSLG
ncbi:cilia- and flagella-associated protein 43-like [Tigriopus californicus]|uniref:cilia- and flagella-associated protein 43-like n=1 Tax=Tigriopus californicus TaxID=6832 RepID=UPI0027D9F3CB|nr:cilia- and flagella-associated protein 43-like [Tigriopus californicus]